METVNIETSFVGDPNTICNVSTGLRNAATILTANQATKNSRQVRVTTHLKHARQVRAVGFSYLDSDGVGLRRGK